MRSVLLLISLIVAVSACSPIATPDITNDMREFLTQKGLSNADLNCDMLGNGVTPGPEAMCMLPLTETDASTMVSTLGLQPKTDSFVSWQPSGPDCWTRLDFHDQTVAKWYISAKDASNLQLPNGMRWLYFRLFYLQNKSGGCISISYGN